MFSPLEQFLIKPIVRINPTNWIDLTISNSTVYMLIVTIIIVTLLKINKENDLIIKQRYGIIITKLYSAIEGIGSEMIREEHKKYIPITISLFLLILVNNTLGLIPYSFTVTAHFIITITMSLSIMIGVTIIGVKKYKIRFLTLFIPSGLNEGNIKYIIPLIFIIELISYLMRIVSLAVRLTANLMSGHTLLKIIANFGLKYTISIPILLILPVTLICGVFLLEIGVSIIQAYVFTLLTITYIKDTELLH